MSKVNARSRDFVLQRHVRELAASGGSDLSGDLAHILVIAKERGTDLAREEQEMEVDYLLDREEHEEHEDGNVAALIERTALRRDIIEETRGLLEDVRRERERVPLLGQLPVLLTITQAAKLMGIEEVTFRSRIQRGQIPGIVRTGKRIQIHRERLLADLERAKQKPGRTAKP